MSTIEKATPRSSSLQELSMEPSPDKGKRMPKPRVWGPGAPGKRIPMAPRLGFANDVDMRRLFGIAGIFFMLVIYIAMGRQADTRRFANAEENGAIGSDTAALDSATRGRPFQGLLDDAQDGLAIDKLDASSPYRTLLWNLKAYTTAEVTSLAETVTSEQLVKSANIHRGRFVRAIGVLLAPLEPRRLPRNEAGFETAWRGYLMDTSARNEIFAFDLYEKPSREFEPRLEALQLDGVFLQNVSYDSRGGMRSAPFIQGKALTPLAGERTNAVGGSWLMGAAVVALALPLVGFLVSNVVNRRREHQYVQDLNKVRMRRLQAQKKKAETPSSPSTAAAPTTAPESATTASASAPTTATTASPPPTSAAAPAATPPATSSPAAPAPNAPASTTASAPASAPPPSPPAS